VADLEKDEVALGGDPLLPKCMAHPYVVRLTARLRRGPGRAREGQAGGAGRSPQAAQGYGGLVLCHGCGCAPPAGPHLEKHSDHIAPTCPTGHCCSRTAQTPM
jgi:hypothetical protein